VIGSPGAAATPAFGRCRTISSPLPRSTVFSFSRPSCFRACGTLRPTTLGTTPCNGFAKTIVTRL
jgi:hypothetical protein